MSDIQSQIKSKIDAFTANLESLVRRAAIEAVGEALGTPVKGGRSRATVETPATPKPKGRRRGKRQRRSPGAMAASADKVLSHIEAHPGLRSEQIRAALGIQKKVWVASIKALLEQKKVTSKGARRATTYATK